MRQAGDIGYAPASYGEISSFGLYSPSLTKTFREGHYIENTGNTTLHFLEIYKSGQSCQRFHVIDFMSELVTA